MNDLFSKLRQTSSEMVDLGANICSNLTGNLDDDILLMCRFFSERQVTQMKSICLLEEQDDVILIARSMFEGVLYLAYSVKHRDMAKRWRMFSVVIDNQRMLDAKNVGETVPSTSSRLF